MPRGQCEVILVHVEGGGILDPFFRDYFISLLFSSNSRLSFFPIISREPFLPNEEN